MAREAVDKKWLVHKFRTEGILDAAGRVIARRGLDRTTMEQVAEEAGISKATIYLYFKNKEALYFNCVIDRFEKTLSEMKEAVKGVDDPLGRLELLVVTQVRAFERDKDFLRVFLTGGMTTFLDTTTEFGQAFVKRHDEFTGLMAGTLGEAMDRGLIRRMDPVKAFALLFSMVRGMAMCKILYDDKTPLSDDVDLMLDVFYNGVMLPTYG